MNRIKSTIIWLSIICAAMTSCRQDDTLRYNNITMGDIIEGTFTSDQGNIFNVVEKTCEGNLEEMERAFIACDVLSLRPGTENEYDIRLNAIARVLVKDAISRENADGDEVTAVADPVHVNALWISGGYINMQLILEKIADSSTKHLVNLVMEESSAEEGKYTFTLRHNSYGESMSYDTVGDKDIVFALAYVSFPLTKIIDRNCAEITFNWKWYKSDGFSISSETQEYSQTVSYTKGCYEQSPTTLSSKASGNIN